MASSDRCEESPGTGGQSSEDGAGGAFAASRWGTVLAAGSESNLRSEKAQEWLCATYWHQLYAYARRFGHDAEEAKDLTQEFFANFLRRGGFRLADPSRGRFRTFLLTSMKNFLVNEWRKGNREKRGGGRQILSLDVAGGEGLLAGEPADSATPEVIHERHWAATLLERALSLLSDECAAAGRSAQFQQFQTTLQGESPGLTQAEIAARLGMTESAYKVAAHRMRARYRELVRMELVHALAIPTKVEEELRYLVEVMSS